MKTQLAFVAAGGIHTKGPGSLSLGNERVTRGREMPPVTTAEKKPPMKHKLTPRALAMAVASAKTALQVWDHPEKRELVMEYVRWVWERHKDELKNEPVFQELVRRGALPP
jgi:hypothetical protein